MHHKIETAAHVAVLDALTGVGVLALPHPDADVAVGLSALHEADLAAMGKHLAALGWAPEEDEDGSWAEAGHARDGRDLIGLYHVESVGFPLSLEEIAMAYREAASAV